MMTKLPPLSVLLAPHVNADLRAPSSWYFHVPAGHASTAATAADQRRATPLYSYAYDQHYNHQQQQPQKFYTSPPSPSSPSWGPPFASAAAPRAVQSPPPASIYHYQHQQPRQPLNYHLSSERAPHAQNVLMVSTSSAAVSARDASGETVTLGNVLQCTTTTPQPTTTAVGSARRPKVSRYLREMDRRAIIKRLDAGEKQCALAKEFNVSRSSICNLFKHRAEVLSRAHHLSPFSKHPKKKCKKNALRQYISSSSAIGSSTAICV